MNEIGSTVRIIAEFTGLVDAEVVAENEAGVVLRLRPATLEGLSLKNSDVRLIKAYYGEVPNPDDPNLAWLGRAHYNNLLDVPRKD